MSTATLPPAASTTATLVPDPFTRYRQQLEAEFALADLERRVAGLRRLLTPMPQPRARRRTRRSAWLPTLNA